MQPLDYGCMQEWVNKLIMTSYINQIGTTPQADLLLEANNLSISNILDTSVIIHWQNNNVGTYDIVIQKLVGDSFVDLQTTTTSVTQLLLINLTPNTSYTFRVVTVNSLGYYFSSLAVSTTTKIITATLSHTNETAPDANDGTITFSSPQYGSGQYQYSIDSIMYQDGNVFTSLSPNTYTCYIRDKNNTGYVNNLGSVTIDEYVEVPVSADLSHTHVIVDCDGTITFSNQTGGSGLYEYSINGGMGWLNNPNFTGLCSGSYECWIRDTNNTDNKTNLGTIDI